VLLSVNPGDLAVLFPGDSLYFVQGEDGTAPSDAGGTPDPNWVTIVSFDDPAPGPGLSPSVELFDSTGGNTLDLGDKLGDILLHETSDTASLSILQGRFKTGFGLGDLPQALTDQPDDQASAQAITVPTGEEGLGATFNSGIAIVSSSGEGGVDWYSFDAREGEIITAPGATMYVQYPGDVPVLTPLGLLDDVNANDTIDDVTVILSVPAAGPYSMGIARTLDATFDVDGDFIPDIITALDEYPNDAASALDLTYDPATQTGLGEPTPPFTLGGFGSGGSPLLSDHDVFQVTLGPGQRLIAATPNGLDGILLFDAAGAQLLDADGNPYDWDLITDGEFLNPDPSDLVLTLDVQSTAPAWSVGLDVRALLSDMTELVTDANGDYVWASAASTPWVGSYIPDGQTTPVDVSAPSGSGGIVVTGDITFDGAATGLGLFELDGTLKGSLGVKGSTLDAGETIAEAMVGYVHGPGGVFTDGNVGTFVSRTTIGEVVDLPGEADPFAPAEFYIGGHLVGLHASSTIFANIAVGGNSNATLGFAESPQDDVQTDAAFLGSPTGNFSVTGHVEYDPDAADPADNDPQDWYSFVPGFGYDVTVELTTGGDRPVWVIAPSGRVVAVVGEGMTAAFRADEGGVYSLLVGQGPDAATEARWAPFDEAFGMDYTINVAGAMQSHVGIIQPGSNVVGQADTSATLMLGDDVSPTSIDIGYDDTGAVLNPDAGLAMLNLPGSGILGNVAIDVAGPVGFIGADAIGGLDGVPSLRVGGIGRLETRTGDLLFESGFTVHGAWGEMAVAGNVGSADDLTVRRLVVMGYLGSAVIGGDFHAQLAIYGEGVDLFHVGGDFGQLADPRLTDQHARLDVGPGGDVAFAYVAGDAYHRGTLVSPTTVTGGTAVLPDDGGAVIRLTPVSTAVPTPPAPGTPAAPPAPPQLTYWTLHVGDPDTLEDVGSVITKIDAPDSLVIRIDGGRADVGYVLFGNADTSTLKVKSNARLGELDIYSVEARTAAVPLIANFTYHGDIVNLTAQSVTRVFVGGSLGVPDRLGGEGGRLPNPNPGSFARPAVSFVTEASAAYFNGVLISGDVTRLEAKVSLGDVHIGGAAGRIIADYDGVTNGPDFSFRGLHLHPHMELDGIVGTVYVAGQIDYLDVGDGLFGGTSSGGPGWTNGGVPVGGVFCSAQILTIVAKAANIQGPLFATEGIGALTGTRSTIIRNTAIGAGAAFSDWALWSQMTAPTERVRIESISLEGISSGLTGSRIQAGVLGKLYVKGSGIVATEVWVSGDPDTGEGINRVVVVGGVLDNTDSPPYVASSLGIFCGQQIGVINLRDGADLINTDITSFKSLGKLKVSGDILFDSGMSIVAPHGIGAITATNVVSLGGTPLHIGAGLLEYLRFSADCEAHVRVDGTVVKAIIQGQLSQPFEVVGPHGSIGRLLVRNGIAATAFVTASNYIGDMDVYGSVAGPITARGSNASNLAIASLHVWGGSLLADVVTEVDPVLGHALPVRPAGGIGVLVVENGNLAANVTATSYFDAGTGLAVTGHIGYLKIVNGDLLGDVATVQHDGAAPRSNIREFLIINGQLPAGRSVTVTGDLRYGKIKNPGGVAVAGNVVVNGAMGTFIAIGDVVTDLFAGEGIEDLLKVKGELLADVYSGGKSGTVKIYGDMIGNVRVENGGLSGFYVYGGQIQAANPALPVIHVDEFLSYLKVIGGDPATPAIDGDVLVGGRMRVFAVRDGSFPGTLDARDIDRAVYGTPDGLIQPLTVTGYLDTLKVLYGPVAAAVSAGGHVGDVYAYFGSTAAGTIDAGQGFDYLYSRDTIGGAVTVAAGDLKEVAIYNRGGIALETVLDVQNGALREFAARGTVQNSMLLAVNGFIGPVFVKGDFTDSSVLCLLLGYVKVTGQVSDTGGAAESINATYSLDVFRIWDTDQFERISLDNNHRLFGGIDVFVG
jgi:hypothetical protein